MFKRKMMPFALAAAMLFNEGCGKEINPDEYRDVNANEVPQVSAEEPSISTQEKLEIKGYPISSKSLIAGGICYFSVLITSGDPKGFLATTNSNGLETCGGIYSEVEVLVDASIKNGSEITLFGTYANNNFNLEGIRACGRIIEF